MGISSWNAFVSSKWRYYDFKLLLTKIYGFTFRKTSPLWADELRDTSGGFNPVQSSQILAHLKIALLTSKRISPKKTLVNFQHVLIYFLPPSLPTSPHSRSSTKIAKSITKQTYLIMLSFPENLFINKFGQHLVNILQYIMVVVLLAIYPLLCSLSKTRQALYYY